MVKLLQVVQPEPHYVTLSEWSHMISAEAGVNERLMKLCSNIDSGTDVLQTVVFSS